MTEALLALVPVWGPWVLAAVTFGSCLALPLPASLLVLTAAALAARGELALGAVFLGALGGALIGDQVAFMLGRAGGRHLIQRLNRHPARAALVDQAAALVQRHGMAGVFLSRWLFSPLAPYVCYLTGATGMRRDRFTIASVAGEVVWAGLYTVLGFVFAGSVALLAQVLGNVIGLLTAGALAMLLVLLVRRVVQQRGNGAPRR